MTGFKRRRYFVHPLQLRLMGLNVIWFLGGIVGTWALVVGPLIARMNDATRAVAERQADAETLLFLHQRLLVALLPGLALILFHSLRVSHRIAGPLVRIRNILRAVAGGDLAANTKLRVRDLLHEESDHLREALDGVATRIDRARAECAALEVELRRARDSELLPANTSGLDERLRALKSELGGFVTNTSGSAEEASPREPGSAREAA